MKTATKDKNNEFLKPLKLGEIVKGKVINKGKSSVFLDLGRFGVGIIYGKEFYLAKETLKNLKVGATIFAKVIDLENEDGFIELSLNQAGKEIAWQTLKEKKEKEETLKVKILGANKGGLLTEISGIPAFLPTSQLSKEHYPRVENGENSKVLKELQKFTGKELEVKIFDIDQKKEKLILSEKAKDAEKIKQSLKNHKIGEVVEGEITGITDFGAFLKFNELEGLIHISELDWQIIENPSEVVKVGKKTKAKIIGIADDKVFLSLKALKKDPWENIEKEYKKGEIVEGEVIKFNPFGAFVRLSKYIQGLVHISEFGSEKKMKESLSLGKKYKFKILLINPKEHRLILKLS